MLEVKNLSYSAINKDHKVDILDNISLSFDKGITVVTGQNGSGKSTLIKLLMNIVEPTSGQIIYNGIDITSLDITERANMGFTIAFQQPVKFKGLTVKELLDIASSKSNKLADVCGYLSKVGLCAKDYINREINSTLSGGELKRIELAAALAKGGEVFLFDEPEAGIDLWSFESLIDLFKGLDDKIVIIVSHQQKIIEAAKRVVVIDADGAKMYASKQALDKIKNKQCAVLGGKRG